MKCLHCGGILIFREKGGKQNNKNLGYRSGVIVLKLICVECGEKWLCNDNKYSHPYQTHPNRLDDADKKKVRVVRLSDNDMRDVEIGKKTLTVHGRSITLAV